MREIVWDTETTGFNPQSGDRLVEIGAIELENHIPTGNNYHQYINPERDMPESAFEVHGLSEEFLRDYPVFAQVAQDFLDFIGDARLIAHNASFDMKFLNAELEAMNLPSISYDRAFDTLELARKKYPGVQNSLDALCRRFGIDNSAREKHGALLDSKILAQVYLELIGGREPGFDLGGAGVANGTGDISAENKAVAQRPRPLGLFVTQAERDAHKQFVDKKIGDTALWHKYDSQ